MHREGIAFIIFDLTFTLADTGGVQHGLEPTSFKDIVLECLIRRRRVLGGQGADFGPGRSVFGEQEPSHDLYILCKTS